jgi:hypothetical protein
MCRKTWKVMQGNQVPCLQPRLLYVPTEVAVTASNCIIRTWSADGTEFLHIWTRA